MIGDLPGLDELKDAGLFDGKLPKGFGVPKPDDSETLRADEDPLGEVGALEEVWGPMRPATTRACEHPPRGHESAGKMGVSPGGFQRSRNV